MYRAAATRASSAVAVSWSWAAASSAAPTAATSGSARPCCAGPRPQAAAEGGWEARGTPGSDRTSWARGALEMVSCGWPTVDCSPIFYQFYQSS